ncbi:uncharacterized protein LOC125939884 [Dermacentor silvarum]|uniref:uncharacterized protein LOC125939884 n=1 Tax=Dermacentor silvarum TaxID=543639 RepID=UPI0021006AD2|nr:uncharacterized protein LOC125939884 [Dermacentor silvarum]
MCPAPNKTFPEDQDIRVAVAAVAQYSGASSLRWLQLHRPPKRSPRKCCAVCVRPVFGAISLWKFVEFMAHYRVVGATSFYFYDLNMTSDFKLLVSRMQSLGVDLTVVSFKLIMDTTVLNQHVHENGQMPALYDCMFRSMFKVEYHVNVDIDELMVPMPNFSLQDMVIEAERIGNGSFGSVVVATRYYCIENPQTMQYASVEFLPLRTRLFAYHSGDIKDWRFTKYIARSRTVCEAYVHKVYTHCAGSTEAFLDSLEPYIRHYRRCCGFESSSLADEFGHFWNVTGLHADASFAEFSARIESDPVVRALSCSIRTDRVNDAVSLNVTN